MSDMTAGEGIEQRGFVENRAAADVDDNGAARQSRQCRGRYDAACFIGQWQKENEALAFLKELRKLSRAGVNPLKAGGCSAAATPPDDAKAVLRQPLSDIAADVANSGDADCAPGGECELIGLPLLGQLPFRSAEHPGGRTVERGKNVLGHARREIRPSIRVT